MSDSQKISCTNGSLKDGSKTYTCPSHGENCYPDSYTYCHKLSSDQKRRLIIGGVIGVVLALIVSGLLSRIPIIGHLGALVINLALLAIIGAVVYIVYNNSKVKEKPNSYQSPSSVYPLACDCEFYVNPGTVYPMTCPM